MLHVVRDGHGFLFAKAVALACAAGRGEDVARYDERGGEEGEGAHGECDVWERRKE